MAVGLHGTCRAAQRMSYLLIGVAANYKLQNYPLAWRQSPNTGAHEVNANGFRAWLMTKWDNLVRCRCRFGSCKNSKIHKVHYRVDVGDLDRVRAKS